MWSIGGGQRDKSTWEMRRGDEPTIKEKKNPSGRKNIPKEGLANNTRKGHETRFESTSHIRDDVKIN